jgi:hypothetical protein
VHLVIVGQCSAATVFKPLFTSLTSAGLETSDFRQECS